MTNTRARNFAVTVAKYFLLTMAISFLGWAFETTYVYFQSGRFYNQGFMRLPFCPIYGCSVMVVYWLLGVPRKGVEDNGGVLLKRIQSPLGRWMTYALFAFLIPSAAELIVGSFFDRLFSLRLWSYQSYPLHINGYVCLPVSLAWTALIIFFMRYLFLPIKRTIFRAPDLVAISLAVLLFFIVTCDMTMQYLAL